MVTYRVGSHRQIQTLCGDGRLVCVETLTAQLMGDSEDSELPATLAVRFLEPPKSLPNSTLQVPLAVRGLPKWG